MFCSQWKKSNLLTNTWSQWRGMLLDEINDEIGDMNRGRCIT